jgi:hypothetical protein
LSPASLLRDLYQTAVGGRWQLPIDSYDERMLQIAEERNVASSCVGGRVHHTARCAHRYLQGDLRDLCEVRETCAAYYTSSLPIRLKGISLKVAPMLTFLDGILDNLWNHTDSSDNPSIPMNHISMDFNSRHWRLVVMQRELPQWVRLGWSRWRNAPVRDCIGKCRSDYISDLPPSCCAHDAL